MTNQPRNPWSVLSGLGFLAPAVLALTEDELSAALAFFVLTVGTMAWHWTRDSGKPLELDRAGMLTSLTTLAAWPAVELVGVLGYLVGLALLFVYSELVIAALAAVVVVVTVAVTGEWLLTLCALLAIGLAYLAHKQGERYGENTNTGDLWHAMWQVLATIAFLLIALAL